MLPRTKRKDSPKIDKPYQFGNGHSTSGNNARGKMGAELDPNNATKSVKEPGEQEAHRPSVFLDKVIKMINMGFN